MRTAIFTEIHSQRGKKQKMPRLATVWLAAGALLCAGMLFQPSSAQAQAFDSSSLSGSFAFQLNEFGSCSNIQTSVGLFVFTPVAGNATGDVTAKFTNYYSDKAGNGPRLKTGGSASGTYTVNPDGSGEIDMTSPNNRKFPFVIDSTGVSGAERIEVINGSLHSWRCAMSGYAIQQ